MKDFSNLKFAPTSSPHMILGSASSPLVKSEQVPSASMEIESIWLPHV
jgi:hypothetical protein